MGVIVVAPQGFVSFAVHVAFSDHISGSSEVQALLTVLLAIRQSSAGDAADNRDRDVQTIRAASEKETV